jgi:hypothetical protein
MISASDARESASLEREVKQMRADRDRKAEQLGEANEALRRARLAAAAIPTATVEEFPEAFHGPSWAAGWNACRDATVKVAQ